MDKKAKESADLLSLVVWADANRKRLMLTVGALLVAGAVVGIAVWHKGAQETAANDALVKLPAPTGGTVTAADAESYLKVANEFGDTQAGARALLVGAGIQFDIGKFKEAQDNFERFVREHPDNALAGQASVGVAACLEAQGKLSEATSRYDDIATRHASESTLSQVKSALGRLYAMQNKPELALRAYEDLLRMNTGDSWSSEAMLEREELLQKNPSLRKPVAPAPTFSPILTPTPQSNSAPPATSAPPELLNVTNK